MRRPFTKLTRAAGLMAFLCSQVCAAPVKDDAVVIVADSRAFTGLRAWWTGLYNESHIYFALLTILVIPLLGALLGVLADFVMSRIGINLRSRELAEH